MKNEYAGIGIPGYSINVCADHPSAWDKNPQFRILIKRKFIK